MFSFPVVKDSSTSRSSKRAVIDQTRRFLVARLLRNVDTLLSLSSSLVRERASFLLHPATSSRCPSSPSQEDALDEAFQWSSKNSIGHRLRSAAHKVAVLREWESWDSPENDERFRRILALNLVHDLLLDEDEDEDVSPGGDVTISTVVFAQRDPETLLAATWVPRADGIVVIFLWENEVRQEIESTDVPLQSTPLDPDTQIDETSLTGRWSYHDATTISSGKEGWNEFVEVGAWFPELVLAEQAFARKTAAVSTKPKPPPEEAQDDADGDDYWNRYGRVEENETAPTSVRSKWSTIQDRISSEDQESNYWDRYAGVTGVLDDDGDEQGKTSMGQGEPRGMDDRSETPADHRPFDSPIRPDLTVPKTNPDSPAVTTGTTSFSHLSPSGVSTNSENFSDDWPSPGRTEKQSPFSSEENAFSSSSVPSASARAMEIEKRREFVVASLRSTLGLARAVGFTNAELMSMIDEATKQR